MCVLREIGEAAYRIRDLPVAERGQVLCGTWQGLCERAERHRCQGTAMVYFPYYQMNAHNIDYFHRVDPRAILRADEDKK